MDQPVKNDIIVCTVSLVSANGHSITVVVFKQKYSV